MPTGDTQDPADAATIVSLHPDESVREAVVDALRRGSLDVRPTGCAADARSRIEERPEGGARFHVRTDE